MILQWRKYDNMKYLQNFRWRVSLALFLSRCVCSSRYRTLPQLSLAIPTASAPTPRAPLPRAATTTPVPTASSAVTGKVPSVTAPETRSLIPSGSQAPSTGAGATSPPTLIAAVLGTAVPTRYFTSEGPECSSSSLGSQRDYLPHPEVQCRGSDFRGNHSIVSSAVLAVSAAEKRAKRDAVPVAAPPREKHIDLASYFRAFNDHSDVCLISAFHIFTAVAPATLPRSFQHTTGSFVAAETDARVLSAASWFSVDALHGIRRLAAAPGPSNSACGPATSAAGRLIADSAKELQFKHDSPPSSGVSLLGMFFRVIDAAALRASDEAAKASITRERQVRAPPVGATAKQSPVVSLLPMRDAVVSSSFTWEHQEQHHEQHHQQQQHFEQKKRQQPQHQPHLQQSHVNWLDVSMALDKGLRQQRRDPFVHESLQHPRGHRHPEQQQHGQQKVNIVRSAARSFLDEDSPHFSPEEIADMPSCAFYMSYAGSCIPDSPQSPCRFCRTKQFHGAYGSAQCPSATSFPGTLQQKYQWRITPQGRLRVQWPLQEWVCIVEEIPEAVLEGHRLQQEQEAKAAAATKAAFAAAFAASQGLITRGPLAQQSKYPSGAPLPYMSYLPLNPFAREEAGAVAGQSGFPIRFNSAATPTAPSAAAFAAVTIFASVLAGPHCASR